MFPLERWGGPEKDRGCGTVLSRDLPSSIIPPGSALGGIPGQVSEVMVQVGLVSAPLIRCGPVQWSMILALSGGQFWVSMFSVNLNFTLLFCFGPRDTGQIFSRAYFR